MYKNNTWNKAKVKGIKKKYIFFLHFVSKQRIKESIQIVIDNKIR